MTRVLRSGFTLALGGGGGRGWGAGSPADALTARRYAALLEAGLRDERHVA